MATSGSLPGAKLSPVAPWYVEGDEPEAIRLTVAYARVSSDDQKSDLDRQVARMPEWTSGQGIRIDRSRREIGSGLNDKPREVTAILAEANAQTIVVEHRDRLARFGVARRERGHGGGQPGRVFGLTSHRGPVSHLRPWVTAPTGSGSAPWR
jgi:putative resolvase